MSLRELRKNKGLSQVELSEISGIRQSTLSQYENGSRKPSMSKAKKLADALNMSLDDIFLLLNISK